MGVTNKKSITELLRAKTGVSIAKFAKNNRVTRQSVYDAIGGRGSRRVRIAIANGIGIPPSMIWPGNLAETKIIDDLHFMGRQ